MIAAERVLGHDAVDGDAALAAYAWQISAMRSWMW